jgi:MoxR-like ATPase
MVKPDRSREALESLVLEHAPALFQAAQSGPHAALVAVRRMILAARGVSPTLADALTQKISSLGVIESARRAPISEPTPTSTPIATAGETPPVDLRDCSNATAPLLSARVAPIISEFLAEHARAEQLRTVGLTPRSTMMLIGPPGVGKTMLASWIAHELHVPLMQIQLSVAISSFLGRTGSNIKDVIDWARREQVVLLFDEFDALAKRRDDVSDLGELKRVVSVLLKELEEWRGPSVILAATNHPGLIDPAIFRRFDLNVTLDLPDRAQTEAILRHHLAGSVSDERLIALATEVLQGSSGSALRLFAEAVRRQVVLNDRITARQRYVSRYRELFPGSTLAEIAALVDVTPTTIHRDLKDLAQEPPHG